MGKIEGNKREIIIIKKHNEKKEHGDGRNE